MYIDLVSLVRDALRESGCDESLISDIDAHSTISLDFEDYPSIFISSIDDGIWLWSRLCEDNGNILQVYAAPLLEKIMQGCAFSLTGQLQLASNENYLELRGIVQPASLENGARFAEALDEFFVLQGSFLEVIR
ncbi:SPI-1 type III secretion system chaperone SpaK [Kalamiella sp. sgz302252]|uniref:InvB/SpaK family type III secretion system chaperone n=1 Tax=Pantoea sp. sgz302252 TaxID=3341827 RepID=UPI0036D3AC9F